MNLYKNAAIDVADAEQPFMPLAIDVADAKAVHLFIPASNNISQNNC